MINGAIEIIRGVRATIVDPLLLPASQGEEMLGYIVITHEERPGSYDLLFLKGSRITECARIRRDLRIVQEIDAVRTRLQDRRWRSLVYLFQVSHPSFDRFVATFHMDPCVKVSVDRLTRRQLGHLSQSVECRRGIVELDQHSGRLPAIDLFAFESSDQLSGHISRLRRGTLLIYDWELNAELRREGVSLPAAKVKPPEASEPPSMPIPPAPAARQGTSAEHGAPAEPQPDGEEFIKLFARIFMAFRESVPDRLQGRLRAALTEVTGGIAELHPGFDPQNLTADSAPLVLDLMESLIDRLSYFRRKPLRAFVLRMVADLYNSSYEILARHGAAEKVERFYARLRSAH
ncbi:MAG TPA: hypothetical protein VL126_09100 [Bacteroidota bacterium]|nr:hypothetical protein [Bacteroidota bacterium]